MSYKLVPIPDKPPIAAVHGCLYTMFQTKKAENPIRVPNEAYPMLMYVLLVPITAHCVYWSWLLKHVSLDFFEDV